MECRSYIAGEWSEKTDGPIVELRNPADRREVVSRSRHATASEAACAVESALDAFGQWRRSTTNRRRAFVEAVLDQIEDTSESLADAIHRETGKTTCEANQEVKATIVEARAQLDVVGPGLVQPLSGHRVHFDPLGAVLLVTPSNFPLAATMRKLVPALICGNTAVVKASELTPVTASMLFGILDRVSLPSGVANLVIADGREVISAMLARPGLRAVSLTGSNEAGNAIAASIGARDIRFQAEMGGSNATIVLADANLHAAIETITEHGYACAGQWCTGTARVIAEDAVYEKLRAALTRRVEQIRVGAGAEMGAMISKAHLQRVEAAVQRLLQAGASLICGGKRLESEPGGEFFAPTLIEAPPGTEIEEIFGPVVVLQRAKDAPDALRLANAGPFGLSFSVFTDDTQRADAMVSDVDAGMCHVNLGTGFRESTLPLLGWKASGRGMPECGLWARDFFTRTKVVYTQ